MAKTSTCVIGNIFQLMARFLSGKFQRVVLNGQTSDGKLFMQVYHGFPF